MLGMPEPLRRPSAAGSNGKASPRHWDAARVENPLARFVPFSSLVSEHDVITRGGDYLRVWRLDGVPFECADEHLIAERHEALCSLLRNLAGGQWAVWTHRIHRRVTDALTEPAERGFARDLSRAYHASIAAQPMMSNELYLTLVYRPNLSRVSRALRSTTRSREEIAAAQADALRVMDEKSALVERTLRGFGPELLGVRRPSGSQYSAKLPSSWATWSTAAGVQCRCMSGPCTGCCRPHACPSAATSWNCATATNAASLPWWTSRSTPTPCSPAS